MIILNNIQVNNAKNLKLFGSKSIIEKEKSIIESLPLTDNEATDRLIIQKCIDDNNLKSDILYDGNTVYPFKKIVNEYRKLQQSGKLEKMTDRMYDFFMNACGDIAYYNKQGYICNYDNSIQMLENTHLKNIFTSSWHTDVDKIFKELKIGRQYFESRYNINVDNLSLKKLKDIIENCGWKVDDQNKVWILTNNRYGENYYSFSIESSEKVSSILSKVQNFYNKFDTNEYAESALKARTENQSLKDIVIRSDSIKYILEKFVNELFYKCEVESELLNAKENKMYDDLEYER